MFYMAVSGKEGGSLHMFLGLKLGFQERTACMGHEGKWLHCLRLISRSVLREQPEIIEEKKWIFLYVLR